MSKESIIEIVGTVLGVLGLIIIIPMCIKLHKELKEDRKTEENISGGQDEGVY